MFEHLKQQMVEKLVKTVLQEELGSLLDCVEPSCFGDPVAMRTRWSPLNTRSSGGSSFRMHSLIVVQNHRMVFRASFCMWLLSSVFSLLALSLLLWLFGVAS